MKKLADLLSGFFIVVLWLVGIVLAKGLWTLLAIIFPPYGWYLIIQKFMAAIGWI